MTPEVVFQRLVTMSALSAAEPSPMIRGVDMSRVAVATRLRELADVSELCARLAMSTLHRDS
jgi:hypothetical protein